MDREMAVSYIHLLASTGQLICIKRGESGYYPSQWDTGDKERNVELADELNERLGVTPAQRQAIPTQNLRGLSAQIPLWRKFSAPILCHYRFTRLAYKTA